MKETHVKPRIRFRQKPTVQDGTWIKVPVWLIRFPNYRIYEFSTLAEAIDFAHLKCKELQAHA